VPGLAGVPAAALRAEVSLDTNDGDDFRFAASFDVVEGTTHGAVVCLSESALA
jgi:hypothetical protein